MTIKRICPMCNKTNTIEVSDNLENAINRYMSGIGYIQDIPLSAEKREFIKTGYCFECQDWLFGGFEEEE